MKRVLEIIFISFLLMSLVACNERSKKNVYQNFSESDSTRIFKKLLKDLRSEMYGSEMYRIKKSEMNEVSDIYCGLNNNIFRISINKNHETLINDSLNNEITLRLLSYYKTNKYKNYNFNFPFYSTITVSEINRNIKFHQKEIDKLKKIDENLEYILKVKEKEIQEWNNIKVYLKALNTNQIKQIDLTTQVLLNYPENFSNQSKLIDQILIAYYQLRNDASIHYFNKSYLSLYFEFSETKNKQIKNRIEALNFLVPIKVLDIPYCEKNDIFTFFTTQVLPPPFNE